MKGSVRKKGNRWYYSFELGIIDGKRKRIERAGGSTKKEALAAMRLAIQEHDQVGEVFTESNITFSEYLDYWYNNYVLVNCKYNTQQYYEGTIRNHIKPDLGIYKLKKITSSKLQEFLNSKYLAGYSRNSLLNFYGVLSGSLKYAVQPCQYIKANPMFHVSLPKVKNEIDDKKDHLLTSEEIKKIFERFPKENALNIPLQIAYHTGMRGGEICALEWKNVDLEKKYISVRSTLIYKGMGHFTLDSPKTHSSIRDIPISKSLIKILKIQKTCQKENKLKYGIHYNDNDFVCTKADGKPITTNSLKYLSRIVNHELMINFNFHALRHKHATMLLENGAHIKDIQKRLGHSNLGTTMNVYSHVTEKMQDKTLDILENLINSNI